MTKKNTVTNLINEANAKLSTTRKLEFLDMGRYYFISYGHHGCNKKRFSNAMPIEQVSAWIDGYIAWN